MNKKNILIIFILLFVFLLGVGCSTSNIVNEETENELKLKTIINNKLNDAEYYLSVGNIEKAREIFLEILEMNNNKDVILPDELIGEIYLIMGYLYEIEFNMDYALNYYLKALKVYRAINLIEESFQSSLLIARTYFYVLNYDKTIEYLNLCLSFYESHIDKSKIYDIIIQLSKIYFYKDGVYRSIEYLEKYVKDGTFSYNIEKELGLMVILSVYYQRNGDYKKYDEITNQINLKCVELKMDKTKLYYYFHKDFYYYINIGKYDLALGLMTVLTLNIEDYFEILRIRRLINDESITDISMSANYFKNLPHLYAGILLIESGYIEGKIVNFNSGLNKITKAINFFNDKNDKYHLAEAYSTRGALYYTEKLYFESIQDYLIASEIYKELGLNFEYAISLKYIAFSFLLLEDNGASLSFLKDSAIAFELLDNTYELAPIYEKLAIIYEKLLETDLQKLYLKKSIQKYIELGNNEKAKELNKKLEKIT